ncbi:O-antigen ligase family protein [Vibrio cholerae]|uniref:O-antigen ligase family protein n=1 Tax=Vibrio tarriae TaxID=2014742 RepID=UPI000DE20F69|nr:O-antigen ligase family protein [Vibrio tarriae]QEO44553.1 O-antigen ligase family protein [Vibrio cholerae]RBM35404.1 hypothetical protein DLR58_05525 [Vibrio tarriae]
MTNIKVSVFASYLISISIMNDAIIFGNSLLFSWAKVLFLLACLLLVLGSFNAGRLKKIDWAIIFFALTSVLFSLYLTGSGPGNRYFSVATSFTIGTLSYFLISRSMLRYDSLRKSFIFCASACSILAIFQSFTGMGYVTDRIFMSTLVPSLYRASGLMSDPNYFALICLLAISLSLGDQKSKISVYICTLALILSGSRSGLLTLLIILCMHNLKGNVNSKIILKFSVSVLCLIVVLFLFREYLPNSISMLFDYSSYTDVANRNSLSDRTIALTAGISAFLENPLFGYGIGNLTSHPLNYHGQMSHVTVIELLAENGIFGLATYFGVVLCSIKLINKLGYYLPDRCRQLLLLFFSLQIMSFTIVIHYSRILFFVLGLIALSYKLIEHEKNNIRNN